MPSLFTLDEEGQPLIGSEAKNQKNPQALISASKRLIGRNFHRAEELQQLFTYDIIESSDNTALVSVLDQVFTMEEISAAIITQLCHEAQQHLGFPIEKAVLTVPTYFDEAQRRSIQHAGEIAGLEVLRILNEPTAAALAYGNKKDLNECIAVYDLGGGTFDLSIVQIRNNSFEVLASGGNPQLGGVDFDDRILRFFLEHIYHEYGYDLAIDKQALHILREMSEQSKITLSTQDQVPIALQLYSEEDEEEFDFSYTLTRSVLEKLTADLVDSTIDITLHLLSQLNMEPGSLDKVLLVGGQSLMPLIPQKIKEALGFEPSNKVHPKEIVAKGASLMALSLLDTEPESMTLQDRLPMTIGVRKSNGTISPLFEQGTILPCKVMRTLPTVRDNQKSILLYLYQGNDVLAHNNEELQTFIFTDLRPGPKGSVRIEALFELNENGILRVKARDKTTKKRVVVQALSSKDLEEIIKNTEKAHSVSDFNPPSSEQEDEPAQPEPSAQDPSIAPNSLITEQPSTLITVTPRYFDAEGTLPTTASSSSESESTSPKMILPTPNKPTQAALEKAPQSPEIKHKPTIIQRCVRWFLNLLGRS